MKTKIILIALALVSLMPINARAFNSADLNQDTCIDTTDFYRMQSAYSTSNPTADLNGSGKVDIRDLAILTHTWSLCPDTVNILDLYPYALDHNLTYNHYNSDGSLGSTFGILRNELWPDGVHFTHHNFFGNVGSTAPNCPRADDVYLQLGSKLYYTDTFYFFPKSYPDGVQDPAGLTRTYFSPGQLWGETTMFKGATQQVQTMTRIIYDIQQTDCVTTSQIARTGTIPVTTQYSIHDSSTWSPFTGGSNTTVPTLLLKEHSVFNNLPDDVFDEEWQFYKSPTYGYVPIEYRILQQKPGEPGISEIAHGRLKSIE